MSEGPIEVAESVTVLHVDPVPADKKKRMEEIGKDVHIKEDKGTIPINQSDGYWQYVEVECQHAPVDDDNLNLNGRGRVEKGMLDIMAMVQIGIWVANNVKQNYAWKWDTANWQRGKEKFSEVCCRKDHRAWKKFVHSAKLKKWYNIIFKHPISPHAKHTTSYLVTVMCTELTHTFTEHENSGYAMLCTDAYVLSVHANNVKTPKYFFKVALPCGDHFLQHDQPILACTLQYRCMKWLPVIPCGVYHIHAKVCYCHSCTAPISHSFR